MKIEHCSTSVLGTHQTFFLSLSHLDLPPGDFMTRTPSDGDKLCLALQTTECSFLMARGSVFPLSPGFNPTPNNGGFSELYNMSETWSALKTKDSCLTCPELGWLCWGSVTRRSRRSSQNPRAVLMAEQVKSKVRRHPKTCQLLGHVVPDGE